MSKILPDRYECTVKTVFMAADPVDAAAQMLENITGMPTWFIIVEDLNSGRKFVVDTENEEIECEVKA